ncbi:MAG: hypothetical protein HFH30_07515 [Eubacterium sp.]|nr:hypothetical protein [Eubacterium sp.]MCI8918518.1 hypothetical protein [Eubacterium sp.]
MNEFLTEPIVLSGEQSMQFIESLCMPSREYMDQLAGIFAKMDQEISISQENMNLKVKVPSLDLSFIDTMAQEQGAVSRNADITLRTEVSFMVECSNEYNHFLANIDWRNFETVSVIQTREKNATRREPYIYNEAGKENVSASVKNKDDSLMGAYQMEQMVFAA